MPFRRALAPRLPEREDLTAAMVGIGMLFAGKGAPEPNIEDTVLAASIAGMDDGDLRVLSVLTTWVGVHASWLNADRLTRIVSAHESLRVRAYWSAIAACRGRDARFKRLRGVYDGPRVDLLAVGTDFQLRRRGEDPRFEAGPLRVPAGTLRDRAGEVLSPEELAARHRVYWWRIVIGPSYRADMWAALECEPGVAAAELARRTYGSFATAWHVRRDFELIERARRDER
jgi:hypothetical protein